MQKIYVIFPYGDLGGEHDEYGHPVGYATSHEEFKTWVGSHLNAYAKLGEFVAGEHGTDSLSIGCTSLGGISAHYFDYVCAPLNPIL